MSNEFKLVPVELLKSALGAVEYLALRGDDIGTSNVPVADALRELLVATPQPPGLGGEPEIIGYGQRDSWGEPFGYWRVHPDTPLQGLFLSHYEDLARHVQRAEEMGFTVTRLYAQPATAKVVLPERRDEDPGQSDEDYNSDCGWNACLDEVAKLNNQPS